MQKLPSILSKISPAAFAYYASFGYWKPARHLYLIAEKLIDIAAGRITRLIITLPPRHGKSSLVSHYFPAWYLGTHPRNRIILTSYESRYAASWGRKARDTMIEHGVPLLGVGVSPSVAATEYWETTLGGVMATAGVGGPITGKGAHVLIIDDPIKNDAEADSAIYRDSMWDWYQSTAYTRLESDPEGSIVLMLTRWHEDDLAGRLIDSMDRGEGDKWEVINLPALAEAGDPLERQVGEALWPERFDEERLGRIRSNLGSGRWWWALYQQRPQPAEGSVFRAAWLKTVKELPESYDLVIQAWDTAIKANQHNDYSACVTIGVKNNFAYVLSVYRDRLEMPGLIAAIKAQAALWKPYVVVIEDAASGTPAMQTLRKETKLPIVPVPPKGDKVARANVVTPYLEGQRVGFAEGPWRGDFEHELLSFPLGKNDDQVDAFVYALMRAFTGGGSLIR